MISITEVTLSNKEDVKNFRKDEWSRFNEERAYEYTSKKYELVAMDKEKIVGYAKYETIGGTAYLGQIIVAKNARNRGVGRTLLKEYEKRAKKEGCHRCYLETSEKHIEALQFYKKERYIIIAELKNHKFHFTWYILAKEI